MSIFVDENTKVVYQGLTGSQGRYYGLLNRAYGTQVVAGTNPKKAGENVEGIPIFASVAEAVEGTGANASCIFIPAAGVRSAVMEAAEGGIEFIVCITEGVPAQDEAWFFNKLKRDFPNVRLLGPNCPGIISPGKCNIGITAGHIAKAPVAGENNVGIVSPLRHAHLPGALRAPGPGHRRDHVCRNRWRPRSRAPASSTASRRSRRIPRPRPS